MKKIRVGVLFGGKSAEHEVSLQSAKNIIDVLDRNKYEIVLFGIDKKGCWHVSDPGQFLLHGDDPKRIALRVENEGCSGELTCENGQSLATLTRGMAGGGLDVVFPVLHGPMGEDGTVQGLLKLANIPFVGAGVLGSAVGMDKDVMKRLLRDAGIPIARFMTFHRRDKEHISYDEVMGELGMPVFVKPANLGSSVGISKARTPEEFAAAIQEAFLFDNKILVEEFIQGREIECSVLGNEQPLASGVGEIIPHQDFYSYKAKYIDETGAGLEIPAKLSDEDRKRVQELAVKTFQVLCCEGMARVDFFLGNDGVIRVNEINTIPGFTKISMYPKLWEISGLSYKDLVDRLIELALERFTAEQNLHTSYE